MDRVVSALIAGLEKGESAVLCCIVAAAGSSPRKSGAKMAVFADGHTVGTVGGGQVEYLAAIHARTMLPLGPAVLLNFDLQGNRPQSIGMVCGGAITIFFRVFTGDDLPLLRRWHGLIDGSGRAWLRLGPAGEQAGSFALITEEDCAAAGASLPPALPVFDGAQYTEPVLHPDRVFLFGGGHVGKALLAILVTVGFSVTLLDDREGLAKRENYPGAERVILADYARIGRDITIGREDYVVVMTSGHTADFEILAQILPTGACYIGCLGSRRKVAAMRTALLDRGFVPDDIDRIHSPIGLPIQADTPEEIAVSIAAEMIAHRAGRRLKEAT